MKPFSSPFRVFFTFVLRTFSFAIDCKWLSIRSGVNVQSKMELNGDNEGHLCEADFILFLPGLTDEAGLHPIFSRFWDDNVIFASRNISSQV